MNNRLSITLAAILLPLAFHANTLSAAPRVVVSNAPLHSLVSGIMQGVGKPVLLFADSQESQREMTAAQKLHLVTADILIWVGPGFEKFLAYTAKEELPFVEERMFALTNHLPLLPRRDVDLNRVSHPENRQAYRDLHFWMDPKLAIMAVRRIALKLADLDPDNIESYLDNEIRLVKKINLMANELAESLAPVKSSFAKEDDLPVYLSWRYQLERREWDESPLIAKADSAAFDCRNLRLVSTTPGSSGRMGIYGDELAAGEELYFRLLANHAQHLTRCGAPSPIEG